ncbi:MAG: M16 family metallopeptidase [Planctomycetota bacterium]|jgi:predicted Zn-dependent peptidase
MRIRTSHLILGALCLFTAASPAVAERLEHEKYQLDNGMTVILREDHRIPRVAVNVWYHVGAREEPAGRSGFAHLFEHLMFMGTHRVPGSQFDEIMETGGGSNNATTGFDRTNYYSSGPASQLPILLWLEADRMEGLGRAMTQEKLDLQREVVRNERRESYDNAPYGPSELLVLELMFPHDHPYHNHVIGSHEDLQRATVEDVTTFFDTFYVPNNASLVVVGDFETASVKPLIEGLFGSIPRGAEPPRRTAPPVSLERTRRVTVSDAVQLPKINLVWHAPPFYAPGDAEMDLIAAVLADGKNSRLYKRLVHDDEIAVDVSAYQWSLRLGSLFFIEVTAAPGVTLAQVESVVDEELERLRAEGPTTRELARAVSGFETYMVSDLQSFGSVADQLNHYDAYLGAPDRLAWDLDRYRRATTDGVRAWAAQVLDPGKRLVLGVVPASEPAPGLPSRDDRPTAAPVKPFTPPMPEVFTLENGLTVWFWDRPGFPLVSMRLVMPYGSTWDGADRSGRASLAAQMLAEGAGQRDALAFADALETLGAAFSSSASHDATTVGLSVLRRNLDPAIDLFATAVRSPRYDADAFDRLRTLSLRRLQQVVDNASALGRRTSQEAFFGPGSMYGVPTAGYPRTLAALQLEDVTDFHRSFHRPEGAVLLVAGDLRRAEAEATLDLHLGSWHAAEARPTRSMAAMPAAEGPLRVLFVDRPGSAQTVVRFMLPGLSFTEADRAGLMTLNTVFGGSFTSRLNANLRERHGYTYGAGSSFVHYAENGALVASAAVQTEVTGAALAEFFREFDAIRSGDVSAAEAEKARATVRAETVGSFETLRGLLGVYDPLARYGLDAVTLAEDLAR